MFDHDFSGAEVSRFVVEVAEEIRASHAALLAGMIAVDEAAGGMTDVVGTDGDEPLSPFPAMWS